MTTKVGRIEAGGIGVVTVAQLKVLLRDWPEVDAYGDSTEVWVSTGRGLSSPVLAVGPLNERRTDDGGVTADVILDPGEEVS